MEKTVVELFAGVGGFRVGLNEVSLENGVVKEKPNFDFVWYNQWEPATKTQHAYNCYKARFSNEETNNNENTDITLVDKKTIPNHTLLVGGFPCQDYSVARSLSSEKGIEGKKGVLWWQIHDILKVKKPKFILLENVDRLLKSPSTQRGRDFGIMLRCLADLGYGVEWKVINAAEYGHPQKRRRVFIFGFHKSTKYFKSFEKETKETSLNEKGFFASPFPNSSLEKINTTDISESSFKDLVKVSEDFSAKLKNCGIMINHEIFTTTYTPATQPLKALKEIILQTAVSAEYFLNEHKIKKFEYLKGSKRVPREKAGISYFYSEGAMSFPENLEVPGRTMLTSEGTVNRSTHVIEDFLTRKKRILDPIECERLNEFPDDWTNVEMSANKRRFMMGNALVCGIIKKLSSKLSEIIEKE